MKKLLLSFFSAIFAIAGSDAQTFTIPHDSVHYAVSDYANMHNDITNISTDSISVSWSVIDHNIPADWASNFGACDNVLCYMDVLSGAIKTTAPIPPGTTGNFYVLPTLKNATSTGTHFVKVRMTHNTYSKDSYYIITRFPTGIVQIGPSDTDVQLYPNPAHNELSISIKNEDEVKLINVTNSLGQHVQKISHTGGAIKLDLRSLPSGQYFVYLSNSRSEIIGVSTFIRQ